MEVNKLHLGDCSKIMQSFEAGSVDLIVTDPPYGYSFMGKDWDRAVPSVGVWRECLRVLKCGAFAFVMSSPRADVLSRMVVNLSEAGFRVDFTPIYWAYASGFPKAMNVSKAVDKRLGLKREVVGSLGSRPIQTSGRRNTQDSANGSFEREDNLITKPASPEAKLLDGSYGGFQPKPAVEVIIVAMKPLSEKTFVGQALRNGKGVTWLDDTRIPFEKGESWQYPNGAGGSEAHHMERGNKKGDGEIANYANQNGRFPANLLVSDDILNDGTISKSTVHTHKHNPHNDFDEDIFGGGKGLYEKGIEVESQYNDMGSFSRYFSLDAWFSKQFKRLPLEVQRTFPFLVEPKASKSERNTNLNKLPDKPNARDANLFKDGLVWNVDPRSPNGGYKVKHNTVMKNNHPTVKPLQLMSYLITLGSRPNDLVLDPFAGSGTTCLAAKMLGRRFIGVELNGEYLRIAEARVNSHKTLSEFFVPEISSVNP